MHEVTLDNFNREQIIEALQENLNRVILMQESDLLKVTHTEKTIRTSSPVPFPLANFIVYLNVNNTEHVADIIADYSHDMAIWFLLPPSTRDIAEIALIDHGFTRIEERPVLAGMLKDVIPDASPIQVVQAKSKQQAEDWISVQSMANDGFPEDVIEIYRGIQKNSLYEGKETFYYVAYDQEQPVGCAILHLAGGVAGFYQLAVIPDARRKGVATALARHRIQDALKHGYHIGGMMVTEMGHGVHSKIGFQEVCKVHMYMKV